MNQDLSYSFEILQEGRKNFNKLISELTKSQLTQIPNGFSNHIMWNIAHVICTQQLLSYGLFEQKLDLSDQFIARYRKGSKPNEKYYEEDHKTVIHELDNGLLKLESNIESLRDFGAINYETSFGISLHSIDDVVKFLVMHEGIHLGYVMAMKKALI